MYNNEKKEKLEEKCDDRATDGNKTMAECLIALVLYYHTILPPLSYTNIGLLQAITLSLRRHQTCLVVTFIAYNTLATFFNADERQKPSLEDLHSNYG